MNSWYNLNIGKTELVGGMAEYSRNRHNAQSLINNGFTAPETFIGSASVKILQLIIKKY